MRAVAHLLTNRYGVYYVRFQRAGVDARRSLQTRNRAEAQRLAYLFNLWLMTKPTLDQFNLANLRKLDIVLPNGVQLNNIHTDADAERARALIAALPAAALTLPPTLAPAPVLEPARPQRKRFETVFQEYLKECSLTQAQKTIDEKQSTYNEFSNLFNNQSIDSYDAESIAAYKNRLLAQATSALRVNKKLSHLRELFAYSVSNGMRQANPVSQELKVAKSSKLKEKIKSYEPFDTEEIKKIFNLSTYKSFNKKPEYFFCPLLAFYTGARLEELASLRPAQVIKDTETGIYYLNILKAKNISSIRKIPIPQKVIETDFLRYVDSVKEKSLIFPNLKPSINGFGKNVGRRFGNYLDSKEVKIINPQKVFHSFRHTFINRMTELDANEILLMALVGHYEQANIDLNSVHVRTYNKSKNKKLAVLKDLIDTFDIEIPRLKYYSI